MPWAQIKGLKAYRKLREKGEAKGKPARAANVAASPGRAARKGSGKGGGKHRSYDDWSKADLVKRAREVGIRGRSKMSKAELIKALRSR